MNVTREPVTLAAIFIRLKNSLYVLFIKNVIRYKSYKPFALTLLYIIIINSIIIKNGFINQKQCRGISFYIKVSKIYVYMYV